jgi:hypothetical protein
MEIMPPEPHWILKGISAALLGAISWIALGYLLNVVVPLAGLVVCCESLGPSYYQFAYWLPIGVSGIVVCLVLLAWAKDPASLRDSGERWREAAKAATLVVFLCLLVMARSVGLI